VDIRGSFVDCVGMTATLPSLDLENYRIDLFSDGDSVYTRENLYENVGTPVKTCLICTGITSVSVRIDSTISTRLQSHSKRALYLHKRALFICKRTFHLKVNYF